ncbi:MULTISPECIES: hypothetical protein [Streptomyces]|uniref:Uncharacterized protein n=1 Tax=Streptomyces thermoviolaceus subsp. thermoviolaceus TaxID=66860 RepID=A0ABX0Z0F1_STRTL|nr:MULTISPECIES: hypothetical protein [Streptomyces]MCM3266136.1 hypothetical protein [Streptomyces thermoviolaceus]NJP16715.1 hypothetical protein [Streptomyces thermoviolaceus subsp. thermoviolaceus]RSS01295.1 hypothetical protein EF917_15575 [Streptomyces sp. WAC00469]WTD49182.1 hypothetical protein OG899_17670 [Streptomyces thermoviolaceus]GGV80584.1 hypothetical protein GCM10010499_43800 [Streptomyces thermoviolaceus subsp. apingens]
MLKTASAAASAAGTPTVVAPVALAGSKDGGPALENERAVAPGDAATNGDGNPRLSSVPGPYDASYADLGLTGAGMRRLVGVRDTPVLRSGRCA